MTEQNKDSVQNNLESTIEVGSVPTSPTSGDQCRLALELAKAMQVSTTHLHLVLTPPNGV